MKNIFILSVFAILFFMATTTQAQDYFKERRYEGIDFTKRTAKKYYVTISRKKYELVDKEEEQFLGQKISFDKSQKLFYIKRQKKAMTFKETINFMKYVGNKNGVAGLKKGMTYYYAGFGTKITGYFVGAAGFFITLASIDSSDGLPIGGFALLGTGGLMYGGGYLLDRKGDNVVKKTLRYHNKNVRKFSKPVIAANDFIPSGLGFKPVRISLLNPTPIPTLSLGWSF